MKMWEEKADGLTESVTKLFVEQPLALPGSAKKFEWKVFFLLIGALKLKLVIKPNFSKTFR